MPLGRGAFLAFVVGALLAALTPVHAADPVPAGRRIALRGFDPVAYFTETQPQRGSEQFWYAFDDAVYLFKSAEHRAKFIADPEQYAPQYEGYCAGGVSRGYKTEPDPEAWAILNGRLFVFEFKERVPMFKENTAFIGKADENWPALRPAPVR
jgi:hypothetical protein